MPRLLLVLVALLVAPAGIHAQEMRMVSGAEGALLGRMRNMTSWLGTLSGEVDGTVVVGTVLTPVEGVELRSGDVVRSLDGRAVESVHGLVRRYDALPAGATVRLVVRRGNRDVVLEFARPSDSAVPRLTIEEQALNGS